MTFALHADRTHTQSLVEQLSTASKRASKQGERIKPFLLLAAISRSLAGKPRLAPYEELQSMAERLLPDDKRRRRLQTAPSFWDLQNDGVWEVQPVRSALPQYGRRPSERSLLASASGGFAESIDVLLRRHPSLAVDVASELLAEFFPSQADAVAEALSLHRHAVRPDSLDPDVAIESAPRLLRDMLRILHTDEDMIPASVAVHRLKAAELTPWKYFGKTGITQEALWGLLDPFGIEPEPVITEGDRVHLAAGYTRTALERGANVPLEAWVAKTGPPPSVPAKAKRIRDIAPRTLDARRRERLQSSQWTPHVLCDASGCYWDGHRLKPISAGDIVSIGGKDATELLNMCSAGHFGDLMRDIIIDEIRWHRIHLHLVEHPSAAVMLRDSLHYPGQEVPVSDRTRKSGVVDREGSAWGMTAGPVGRARAFDPSRTPGRSTFTLDGPSEETMQLREQANQRHHEILVALHQYLIEAGWQSIEEIPGSIDLWAVSASGQRVIFEAKTVDASNAVDQCRAALAQLLEYRFVLGKAADGLCVVVDGQISERRLEILEVAGIAVLLAQTVGISGLGDRGRRLLQNPRPL